MTSEEQVPKRRFRQDCLMFGLGLFFIAALMAAIFGIGHYRKWDAPSGYFHNQSASRFLPEPYKENDPYPEVLGRSGRPDLQGQWYYWQNKPNDVTLWTHLSVWLCYSAHQISIWVVTYLAQVDRVKTRAPRKGIRLNKYNWWAFGLNTFFHVLHLVQTHTTYDGLAQDTTVTSSQCSAIMLTLMILLLEYNERGLFFGWPNKKIHKDKFSQKLTLNMKPTYLIRKYHGYAFAWASIFTIWYHPMENTYGHALGFFHTWILMLQGSLMYTDIHWNRWWRLLLECWVVLHSTLVAIQTSEPGNLATSLWPMFLFGFLFTLAVNQIYILSFWEKIPQWVRAVPPIVYLAIIVGAYSVIPDINGKPWFRIQEVVRIPAVYYVAFILVWAFMYLCVYIDNKLYGDSRRGEDTTRRIVCIFASVVMFVLFNAVSVLIEIYNVPIGLFVGMALLTIIFSIGSALTIVLAVHIFPRYNFKRGAKVSPLDEKKDATHNVVNEKMAMAYIDNGPAVVLDDGDLPKKPDSNTEASKDNDNQSAGTSSSQEEASTSGQGSAQGSTENVSSQL